MRTTKHLFEQLVDPAYLAAAASAVVRGKRRRPDVASFLFCREERLERIRAELAEGTWWPQGFEMLTVRHPKPRLIARVPVEDRVVHTALVTAMEPALTRTLLPECMACRPGLGTHRAVIRLLGLMRRHRYAVHLDVRAYFPSIDQQIVLELLARRIRDARFLEVMRRVVEVGDLYADPQLRAFARLDDDWPPPGRGLPIGAYTSQALASWLYLDALDHEIKRHMKVPGYLRYVDDLFLFGDSRADLRRWRAEVAAWLDDHRHLRLKHPRARVLSCAGHLHGLGHRIHRDEVVPLPRVMRRMQSRLRSTLCGPGGPDDESLRRSLASTGGVWMFGAEVGPEWRCRGRHGVPSHDKPAANGASACIDEDDVPPVPAPDTLSRI